MDLTKKRPSFFLTDCRDVKGSSRMRLWCYVLCGLACVLPSEAAKNVLWIIADDLKHMNDIPGFSLTPVMDKIKSRGVVFENAHSQYSMCGPSRLSFMSGIAPHNIYNGKKPGLSSGEVCNLRDRFKGMLSINQLTKKSGVKTFGYGKIWHGRSGSGTAECPYEDDVVDDRWTAPANDGIPHCEDENPNYDGRTCIFSDRVSSSYDQPGVPAEGAPFPKSPRKYHTPTYVLQHVDPPREKEPNIYMDAAHNYRAKNRLRELMKTPEESWMLVVGYQRPHLPFTVPKRILMQSPRLDIVNVRPPALEPSGGLFRRHSPPAGEWMQYLWEPEEFNGKRWDLEAMRRGYYASVRFVDSLLGELMEILESNPTVRQDTAIIVMGDHGFWIGDRTLEENLNKDNSVRNHAGFCKHATLEGAARTELIIDAPEISPSMRGKKSEAPVELLDIYPTIMDLFGIEKSQTTPPQKLDGTSLMPILTGEKTYVKAFARNGYQARTSFRTKRHRVFVDQIVYGSTNVPKSDRNIVDVVDYAKDPSETREIKVDAATLKTMFENLRLDVDPNGKEPFDKDGPFGHYCCDTVEKIESHLRPWSFPV